MFINKRPYCPKDNCTNYQKHIKIYKKICEGIHSILFESNPGEVAVFIFVTLNKKQNYMQSYI